MTTFAAIVLVIAGFAASRLRFVRGLNSRRFMPFVYAVVAVYFASRAYAAHAGGALVWPNLLCALLFLSGVIESARAAWVTKPE